MSNSMTLYSTPSRKPIKMTISCQIELWWHLRWHSNTVCLFLSRLWHSIEICYAMKLNIFFCFDYDWFMLIFFFLNIIPVMTELFDTTLTNIQISSVFIERTLFYLILTILRILGGFNISYIFYTFHLRIVVK